MNDIDPTKPLMQLSESTVAQNEVEQKVDQAVNAAYREGIKQGRIEGEVLADPQVIDIKKEDIADGIQVKTEKLNERQELFCQLYATDREFFGNGVQTYIEVYEPDTSKPNWYKTVCAAASRLLSEVKVCKRINELIEANGLNDNYVDKQLEFLVTQHADFKAKLGAIKEYNALKTRIVNRLDLTSKGEQIKTPIHYIPEEKDEEPV
jgi:hypothetical protein